MRHEAEQGAAMRAQRLLAVTTGLGRAQTPEEVADVIFREGLAALGADAGSLAMIHDGADGPEFETVRIHGYRQDLVQAYRRYPLRAGRPVSDAVLAVEPVLLAGRDELERRYPDVVHETGDFGYEAFAAVPIVVGGRAMAAFSASFRERVAFDAGTRTFLATLGEQCGLALERARAFAAVRRAEQASAFLAEASALLGESLDYEATLRSVAEAAVPRLGDWCAVDVIVDPTSTTWPPKQERVAVFHRDRAMMALGRELEEKYPADRSPADPRLAVLRDRVPIFVPVVTDEMLAGGADDAEHLRLLRALHFSSVIVVPLVARGLTLGALTLCHTESGRRYDAGDLALAEDLAHRAAVAVDNARLYRDVERARAEAEAANRAKSQFLSTMSHELRTPLNAISGYVDLLDLELRGPINPTQRDDLSRIRHSSKVLMSLVNDVLNFARLEAGQVEVHVRGVTLADVLGGLETLVRPQVQAKALAFECSADRDLVARADPDRVEQILTNLLTNAIKFTEPGGRVSVTAGRGAARDRVPQVWVRVADTGRGIPAEQLQAIFEPFVQLDRHLSRESQQGVGLGLSISSDLARLMGGALTVESVYGEGSTFTLVLPADDGSRAPDSPSP
jgi:signal transduction histidine kinase